MVDCPTPQRPGPEEQDRPFPGTSPRMEGEFSPRMGISEDALIRGAHSGSGAVSNCATHQGTSQEPDRGRLGQRTLSDFTNVISLSDAFPGGD